MVDIAAYPDAMDQIMGKTLENPAEDVIRKELKLYGRIQIPIRNSDKSTLRECAALLRTLSEEMRILADRHDISQTVALHWAHGLVKSTNARMQDSTKYRKLK